MTIARIPDRALVERVIREEASSALISADAVIGRSLDGRAVSARAKAIRRILRETGCSEMGLANVWGISNSTVRQAVRFGKYFGPPATGAYDVETAERLTWAHGAERARQIIAGHDPATQADLAAWRRIWIGPHWARP